MLFALLALGCAEQGPPEEIARTSQAERFGVITVVHSGGAVPGGADGHVRVTAFFPRHVGRSRNAVLEQLNIPDVPDAAMWSLGEERCQLFERNLAGPPPEPQPGAFVDLMDAGELRLQVPEQLDSRIQRRVLPEIFPSMGGVTYELDLPELVSQEVSVLGGGSRDITEFSVDLVAPSVPTLIALDGQPLLGHYPAIDWASDLQVNWSRPLRTDPTHTRTFLELSAVSFDRAVSIRCRARDNGRTVIPRSNLLRLSRAAGEDATISLVVRRVFHTPVSVEGLDNASAYYVSRDSVLLR